MVKQYPYTLQIPGVAANSTQDASGNWIPSTDPLPDPVDVPCRAETRSSIGYVQTSAGKKTEFQCIVYMPTSCPDVKIDTNVTILNGDTPIIKGTVKHFSRGQLNARIWI